MHAQHVVQRSLVLVTVLLLTLSGLPDGSGFVDRAAAQPTISVDVRTYDREPVEAVTALVPGQTVLVVCDYEDLSGTYRIGVRDIPERSGESPFLLFVEDADSDVRVTDGSGTVAFSYTIPDWYPEFDRVRLYCVVFDQDGEEVPSLTRSEALTWGTNLYLDVDADRPLEDDPVDVTYYGWVLPDETPLTIRVVANGQIVAEDTVTPSAQGAPIEDTVRVVPGDVVAVERERRVVLQLLSRPPGEDNTYWATRNLTVMTRPRFDQIDIRSTTSELSQAATTGSSHQVRDPVQFEASAFDPDGGDVDLRWEFGDGNGAEGPLVTHAYDAAGTYRIRLVAIDDEGVSAEMTRTVRVVNLRPDVTVVAPDPDSEFVVDREIPFEVRAVDPDGGRLTVRWNFGDGTTATGPLVSHRFTEQGTYEVTVTVIDDEAAETVRSVPIQVLNLRPEVSLLSPDDVAEHLVKAPVTFDARGHDPDGGDIEFRWTFGDGTTEVGPRVTHSFSEAGTYTVVLDVTDEEQSTTRTTLTIQVIDLGPTAEITLPAHDETYLVGREIEFEGQGSDPDGGDVEYQWDFDDGSTAFGPSATHTFTERGTYDVTLTITDDEGSTSETRLTVEVRPPGVIDTVVATIRSLRPEELSLVGAALLAFLGLLREYLKRRQRGGDAAADAE